MTPITRRLLLVASPLALAALLLFHPVGGERVYEGICDDATSWLVVHIGMAILAGLMAAAAYTLLRGLRGRAATISRLALAPFTVFFIAWEATLGIGTGILVNHANSLPAGERAPVAEAIQDYFNNPIFGSFSVFGTIGNTAWIVAMIAAAIAFRRARASRTVTLLIGFSSVFVLHDAGPVGALGLTCFAAAAALIERSRTADARAYGVPAGNAAMAPSPT